MLVAAETLSGRSKISQLHFYHVYFSHWQERQLMEIFLFTDAAFCRESIVFTLGSLMEVGEHKDRNSGFIFKTKTPAWISLFRTCLFVVELFAFLSAASVFIVNKEIMSNNNAAVIFFMMGLSYWCRAQCSTIFNTNKVRIVKGVSFELEGVWNL